MLNRPSIIPRRTMWRFALIVGVYELVAVATGFIGLTFPYYPPSPFLDRLREATNLWTLLCIGWIVLQIYRKRTPPEGGTGFHCIGPLVLISICIWMYVAYSRFQEGSADWLDWFQLALAPAFVLIGLVLLAVTIGIWQQRPSKYACVLCNYSLANIASDRCPECGLHVESSDKSPGELILRKFPELLLFRSSEERDAALQSQVDSGAPRYARMALLSIHMVFMWAAITMPERLTGSDLRITPLLLFGAVVLSMSACDWAHSWWLHRRLYRELDRLRVQTCFRCGAAFRDAEAAHCEICEPVARFWAGH